MGLSAPNVATETCMTQGSILRAVQRWHELSAGPVTLRENGMSESHNEKLRAALAWLGDRYLCAVPQKPRVRR